MTRSERIGRNFKRLKESKGWSNPETAARGNVGVNYISQIENGLVSFGTRAQEKWAKIFEVDVSEFLKQAPMESNVEPAEMPYGKAPLISWVHAGQLEYPFDPYQPGYAEDWVPTDVKDPNVFALTVDGDSMEPEFKNGEIIIVAPNIEPQSGDFVVAKLDGQATLKQIFIYLNKIVLKPLNEVYEPIEIERSGEARLKIVGKVKQKIKSY